MSGMSRQEIEAEIIAKAWKDPAYKQRLLADPKAVFEEALGQKLVDNAEVKIVEETATSIYLVLPANPDMSAELSDEELDAVAGGAAAQGCQPGVPGQTTRPTLTACGTICIPCASHPIICPVQD